MTRHTICQTIAGILLMAALPLPAGAAVVRSLDGATAVAIPALSAEPVGTSGPITFGPGITFTSTSRAPLFGYTGEYGFTRDVLWRGVPMIGLDATRGTMTLSFATPLAGFLADIMSTQYTTSADAVITAFDATGRQLDSILLERNGYQVTPGYMGFSYASPLISRITFANEFIGLRNISIVAPGDVGVVPEPVTWGLMIVGMGMIGARLRRTRRTRRAGLQMR